MAVVFQPSIFRGELLVSGRVYVKYTPAKFFRHPKHEGVFLDDFPFQFSVIFRSPAVNFPGCSRDDMKHF